MAESNFSAVGTGTPNKARSVSRLADRKTDRKVGYTDYDQHAGQPGLLHYPAGTK
jgi:hypothetical protein